MNILHLHHWFLCILKNRKSEKTGHSYKHRILIHSYFNEKYFFLSVHGWFFSHKIESNYHNYQTNVTVIDESHKWKFLFPMREFSSFRTDNQSILFMSAIFLKHNIDGVRVQKFQLTYIYNTAYPSHENWLSYVMPFNICGGGTKSWSFKVGGIA